MYYHCSDDGYIVSSETECRREVPFPIPLPERDFIITKTNLSSIELVQWIIGHLHIYERMNESRRIAISAIDEVFRDQENN